MSDSKNLCRKAVAYLKGDALKSDGTNEIMLSTLDEPVMYELENGLHVAYLVDQDDSFLYIQRRHILEAGITVKELHVWGCANLTELAKKQLRVENKGTVYAVILDGNFEASLLLLDDLWEKQFLHAAINKFVVAIPSRDVLAFCDSDSKEGIDELKKIISRVHESGDHLIIPSMFLRQSNSWVQFKS